MPRIVTPAEFRAQPWKNGGGVTHEIVRWPDAAGAAGATGAVGAVTGAAGGAGAATAAGAAAGAAGDVTADDAYEIRISIADDRVPGPFSRFPGYRRWSFLAGGAPIVLDVAGTVHELTARGDHLEVDGDVPIACALPAGPTRLFNILVRHGVAATVGHGPCPFPIRFAFALEAMAWLPEGHAAVFDPPERAPLARHAVWLR